VPSHKAVEEETLRGLDPYVRIGPLFECDMTLTRGGREDVQALSVDG